jgi:DNA-binding FadR family transcriptional regulator
VIGSPGASARHDGVLTAVGTDIASGILAPGQVITLDDISVQHRVSRSLAREVIRVLESMGMVASRRRIGLTIQPPQAWNVLDPRLIRWCLSSPDRNAQLTALAELRRGFEPAAAALAAGRAGTEDCRELAVAVSDLQMAVHSADHAAYRQADKDFHRIVVSSSGNPMFRALGELMTDVPHCGLSAATAALHDTVAWGIRQGDAASAEDAMRAIVGVAVGNASLAGNG